MGYTWERFLPPYSLKMARIWQWAGGDAGADGAGDGSTVDALLWTFLKKYAFLSIEEA